MNEIRYEAIIELCIAVGLYVWLKVKVSELKKQVDVIKKDADNFGEILGTTRAKARLLKTNKGAKK